MLHPVVCCRLCRCENGSAAEDSFSGRAGIHPRADHVGQRRGRPTTPCTPGNGLPSLPRQESDSRSRHRHRSSIPPAPRSSAPPNLDTERPATSAVSQRGPAHPSRHAEVTDPLRTGSGVMAMTTPWHDPTCRRRRHQAPTSRCWSPSNETIWAPGWSPTWAMSRRPARCGSGRSAGRGRRAEPTTAAAGQPGSGPAPATRQTRGDRPGSRTPHCPSGFPARLLRECDIDDVRPQALAAAGNSPTLANPSITRGSLITTDNGDLACDDDAGRVLIELNGRFSRDRR